MTVGGGKELKGYRIYYGYKIDDDSSVGVITDSEGSGSKTGMMIKGKLEKKSVEKLLIDSMVRLTWLSPSL